MPPARIPLFQYGSNMDPARLNHPKRLNGVAEVLGSGRLDGWGIRFDLFSATNGCAVTDIVPSAQEYALGLLYTVPYRTVVAPRGQRSRMDEIEGARRGRDSNYKRITVVVTHSGREFTARTYVGTAAGRNRFPRRNAQEKQVSEQYFGHLLAGADRFGFPEEYKDYLRNQAGRLRATDPD